MANATAAMKLVADSLRDRDAGFWYGYHQESHTSLVGVRELAVTMVADASRSDGEVENWLEDQALATTCADDSVCLLWLSRTVQYDRATVVTGLVQACQCH